MTVWDSILCYVSSHRPTAGPLSALGIFERIHIRVGFRKVLVLVLLFRRGQEGR
jgi:hypothetical protein